MGLYRKAIGREVKWNSIIKSQNLTKTKIGCENETDNNRSLRISPVDFLSTILILTGFKYSLFILIPSKPVNY